MALSRKPQEIVDDSKNPLLTKHESWGRVPVGDIADILNGFAFKSSKFTKDQGVPLIRIRDVGKDSTETYYDGEFDETYLVDDGDLLVGMDGDFRSSIWKGGKALLNQRVCKISLKTDDYDFKFLSYVLQPYLDAIHAETSAVTVKHLSSRSIGEIPLPLPPKEQQKRIVAKIEELFSRIDAGIEALKKAKQLLKQYRQSVLKAAVTGEIIGKEFSEVIYKSVEYGLESLGQGWSPKCEKEPSPSEDVWGVIKTTSVQSLEYLQEENKRLPDKLEPRPHLEVKPGDILVTRAGPRVRVGVCCLVKETRKKLMICDKVYRLRLNTSVILPEYLEIVLNAPQVQDEIGELKTGISDSGVNLTQKRFVELQVPYPDIKDQKKIVDLVYEKVGAVSRLEKAIDSQLGKAEENKQSVLVSAFSGFLHIASM